MCACVSKVPPVIILYTAETELDVDCHDHAVDHSEADPYHQVEESQQYHLHTHTVTHHHSKDIVDMLYTYVHLPRHIESKLSVQGLCIVYCPHIAQL